jgi:hypothetical protein
VEVSSLAEWRIATIASGSRPAELSEIEACAYDVAHALTYGGVLPEAFYSYASKLFGQHGTNELIYLTFPFGVDRRRIVQHKMRPDEGIDFQYVAKGTQARRKLTMELAISPESVGRMVESMYEELRDSQAAACRFATKCYQRGWGPYRYLYERNGRHDWTRTSDLYRVKANLFNPFNNLYHC